MENFDQNNTEQVKKKNVYLLHLDKPRIVVVTASIIGIIIASFLLGMNYLKDETPRVDRISQVDSSFADDTAILDKDTNFSEPSSEFKSSFKIDDENPNVDPDNLEKKNDLIAKTDKSDVFTAEDIKEVIPAVKPVKEIAKIKPRTITKKPIKKKKIKKVASKKLKTHKKVAKVKTVKRKKNISKVVPVSISKVERVKHVRVGDYSIQVASYDKRSKAKKEMRALKSMRYDAYVDKSKVNGRNYYRVRIGPISSKREAVGVLNDIQDNERYEDSYLIRR